jgi:AcrR family transcriptional regulator
MERETALSEVDTHVPVRRNRPATEQRLRLAVEELLVEGGFACLSPSAVAKRAGVDKMLIYRYFGDLPGLVRTIAFADDFFPSFDQICGGKTPDDLRAMPVNDRAAWVIGRNLRALYERPVVLELMVWELIERNELTAIMEEARESLGQRMLSELFSDVNDQAMLQVIGALLMSGTSYLALRRRKIRWFGGVDLNSDSTPDAIEAAIQLMTLPLLKVT